MEMIGRFGLDGNHPQFAGALGRRRVRGDRRDQALPLEIPGGQIIGQSRGASSSQTAAIFSALVKSGLSRIARNAGGSGAGLASVPSYAVFGKVSARDRKAPI